MRILSQAFNREYGSLSSIFAWLSGVMFHLLTQVLPRRFSQGPARQSWSIVHELVIEAMQFSYRWHIEHGRLHELPYEAVWSLLVRDQVRSWHSLTPVGREEFRLMVRDHLGITSDELRSLLCIKFFRYLIEQVPSPPYWPWVNRDIRWIETPDGPIQVDIIRPSSNSRPKQALLYVHGGGFNFRIEFTWRLLVMYWARSLDVCIVIPHYHLAPEFPFPSAIEDIVATYQFMIDQDYGLGYKPDRIGFVGESAGAGAIVSACLMLRERQLPKPACAWLMSPWIDLTCAMASSSLLQHETLDALLHEVSTAQKVQDALSGNSSSWTRHEGLDILYKSVWPWDMASHYVSGVKPKKMGADAISVLTYHAFHPHVSPLFASSNILADALPPVMIQLGGKEYLLDEGLILAKQLSKRCMSDKPDWLRLIPAKQLWVQTEDEITHDVVCEVYEDMTHVFQLLVPLGIPSAQTALKRGRDFMARHLH